MVKKIMILGSAGMLGHIVYYHLKSLNKYNIVDASFPEKLHDYSKLLDVTNALDLEEYITEEKPNIVVNCIGILIKGSQINPSNAIYLNSYFPHQLSKILRKTGGKLIHVSTDCVFSGKKGNYTENDFRDADDIYGRSKALGEIINHTDVTLRTSIIGPELKEQGEGLFHWFMRQNEKINGYSNVFWGGVTTLELAKAINHVIDSNLKGLIHVTNGKAISKLDFLIFLNKIFRNNKLEIESIEKKFSNKSLVSERKDVNFNIPDYETMTKDLYSFMLMHKNSYEKYFI